MIRSLNEIDFFCTCKKVWITLPRRSDPPSENRPDPVCANHGNSNDLYRGYQWIQVYVMSRPRPKTTLRN